MGDLDNFVPSFDNATEGPQGAAEKSSEAREQARDQFQKSQKALAQSKKDEKKAKKKDNSLANVLSQFVKENKDKPLTNTIISIVKQDISPEFVLGILSLYFPNLKQIIYDNDSESSQLIQTSVQITMAISPIIKVQEKKDFDENNLPPEVKQAINTWVQDIMYTSFLHPDWLLPRVYHNKEVNSTSVHLAALIFRNFLLTNNIEGDFDKIKGFSFFILNGVLQKTFEHVYNVNKRIE